MADDLMQRELDLLRKLVRNQERLLDAYRHPAGGAAPAEALGEIRQARAELESIERARVSDESRSEPPRLANPELREWLVAGRHLPRWLRDFHAQKEIFKTVGGVPSDGIRRAVSWVDGHIYVIDRFLWHMGRWGFALQRSRAQQRFDDMDADVAARRTRETLPLPRASAPEPDRPGEAR